MPPAGLAHDVLTLGRSKLPADALGLIELLGELQEFDPWQGFKVQGRDAGPEDSALETTMDTSRPSETDVQAADWQGATVRGRSGGTSWTPWSDSNWTGIIIKR